MKLCLPADFSIGSAQALGKLQAEHPGGIEETYGNLNPSPLLSSGRGCNNCGLPAVGMEQLAPYVEALHRQGIRFNYTLNASCTGNVELTPEGRRQILDFIDELVQNGVDAFTVAASSLIQLIHHNFPRVEICASAIIGVDSLQKAKFLHEMGANRIVLLEDENRNFNLLRALSKHCPAEIELIANPKCAFLCPMRASHYNSFAHDHSGGYYSTYFTDFCEALSLDNFLKIRWIRPEDIATYESYGVEHIKLIERVNVDQADPFLAARTYLSRHFEGNLLELLYAFKKDSEYLLDVPNDRLDGFLDFWIRRDPDCRNKCGGECRYCETYLDRNVEIFAEPEPNGRADQFFKFGVIDRMTPSGLQRLALEARL